MNLFYSRKIDILERLVKGFKIGKPFYNAKHQRIGTVLKIWRSGHYLVADVECVIDELKSGQVCYTQWNVKLEGE